MIGFLGAFAFAIFVRIGYIFTYRKDYLEKRRVVINADKKEELPLRGSIYDENGNTLVAYIAHFDVDFDPMVSDRDSFYKHVDSLAFKISKFKKDKTPKEYRDLLVSKRENKKRYVEIARNLTFQQMQEVKKFPILKYGKSKGGLIVNKKNLNVHTADTLMRMTLGKTIYDNAENVVRPTTGLEAKYHTELQGTPTIRYGLQVPSIGFIDSQGEDIVKGSPSLDIVSSLNVDLQYFAHKKLLETLKKHKAKYGTVVVMEVETGFIKAMVNLGRVSGDTTSQNYNEWQYNYAVGIRRTPGSTFKTAVILAALEDKKTFPDEVFNLGGKGQKKFANGYIRDDYPYDKLTTRQILEYSSNIGTSSIIHRYADSPQKLLQRLNEYGFGDVSGIDLNSEAEPDLNVAQTFTPRNINIEFYRMSFGYVIQVAPIQMLTFYNAIANKGLRVEPRLVKAKMRNGMLTDEWDWRKHSHRICDNKNLVPIRQMLEGVVLRGTARNLKPQGYTIAGKSGTTWHYEDNGSAYSKKKFDASFVGYFPADNPKYSCIVLVAGISDENEHYGATVAAPVLRDIADKLFYEDSELNRYQPKNQNSALPDVKNGYRGDIANVLKAIGVGISAKRIATDWVYLSESKKAVAMNKLTLNDKSMPNIIGMSAKDAVFLLESRGYVVKLSGRGKVVKQSVAAGEKTPKGTSVTLTLS